jgi:RNA polymerase sigma-32 factor
MNTNFETSLVHLLE